MRLRTVLNTICTLFSFAVDLNSSKNINPKKYLIVKNNGDADCVFSVLGEAEYQRTHKYNGERLFYNIQ